MDEDKTNQTGYKKLTIFVASPIDVSNERSRLTGIVERLNSGLASFLGIVLELKDWSEVFPSMGRGQQVIFDQIPVASWDVMIGIMWMRYGTPSGGLNPEESGTHEELNVAYECWKRMGKPRIMFYRCTRPPADITKIDIDALVKIDQFFKGFETGGNTQGLYKTYDTPEAFERLVRDHLEKFLFEYCDKEQHKKLSFEDIRAYVPKTLNTLPRQEAFFGRDEEMKKVLTALAPEVHSWGVVIDGIGGIGKTALAIEAAYRSKEKAAFDAYIFVSAKTSRLEPSGIKNVQPIATTFEMFINETARALGQTDIIQFNINDRKNALLDFLRNTHSLLIYDNLETIDIAEQDALVDWLRYLPQGCKSIITSRKQGGEGAIWIRLEKINLETALAIIMHELERDGGLKKKLLYVGEKRWLELYDETGGSPLALLHVLGLMRIRITLSFDNAIAMIRNKSGDADLLQFVFEETFKELDMYELQVLYALSFFTPSASFQALQATADISRQALGTIIERLSALSLIDVMIHKDRFNLHPLTRAYIRQNLSNSPKAMYATTIRFARYWVGYAIRYGNSNNKPFDHLEAEWINLKMAYQWLKGISAINNNIVKDRDAARLGISLVSALRYFLINGEHESEGLEMDAFASDVAHILNISYISIFPYGLDY